MRWRYLSQQEKNLTILTRVFWWAVLVSVAFCAWWLYQGLGFFKDEMSFQVVYDARHHPKPLPVGTVSASGFGFEPAQLLPVGAVAPPMPPAIPGMGRRLYHDNCSFCHAMDGTGDAPVGIEYDPAPPNLRLVIPTLTNAAVYGKVSDGMLTVPGIDTYPPLGPDWHAFRLYLDPYERWQIVLFLRSAFGSGAPATRPGATAVLHPEYHIVGNPPEKPAPRRRH